MIGKEFMGTGPIRLVLAGSDLRMQEQVRAVIATQPQILLSSDVTGGEEALAAVTEFAPDVLVLDMQISGVHACNVTRTALTRQPQLGIVVWIELDDGELPEYQAWTMQRAGVCCVDSAADHAEIEQAIVAAATGKAFLSRRLTLRRSLTPREHEVLALLATGWTRAQIARTLKIAPATVSSHTARICGKLGLAERAAAAEAGRDLGLVEVTTDRHAYYSAYRRKQDEFYQAKRASGL